MKGAIVNNDGGLPHKWNLQTVGNSSAEAYVEGQAAGTPSTPEYDEAIITLAKYLWTWAEVTGHVTDQQRQRGFYEDPIKKALDDATIALMVLFNSTLLGSEANHSLAAAIDAVDVYASLDPGVLTSWASVETAVSGALTVAVLNTHYRTLADRGASPDTVLVGSTQYDRYLAILGPTATNVQALPRGDRGQPYDLGMRTEKPSFNGTEWNLIRGMTATELYMLDMASGVEVRTQRDIETKKVASTADSEKWMVTISYLLKVTNRRFHGKLTGLTSP